MKYRTNIFDPRCESPMFPLDAQRIPSPGGLRCNPCLTAGVGNSEDDCGPWCCCNDFSLSFPGVTSEFLTGGDARCDPWGDFIGSRDFLMTRVDSGVRCGPKTPSGDGQVCGCFWTDVPVNTVETHGFPPYIYQTGKSCGASIVYQENRVTGVIFVALFVGFQMDSFYPVVGTPYGIYTPAIQKRYICNNFTCRGGLFEDDGAESDQMPGVCNYSVTLTWPETLEVIGV